MKLKRSTMLWTFFWCWFMGVTAISIGLGALFPSINLITKPFVCLGGKMDLVKQVYNPYPGNTITTLTWYCVDEASGTKTELSIFPMSLYAGTIYGWLLFGVVGVGMVLIANGMLSFQSGRNHMDGDPASSARLRQDDFTNADNQLEPAGDTLSRMKELKELRAANLISETEYEEKRAEILKSL